VTADEFEIILNRLASSFSTFFHHLRSGPDIPDGNLKVSSDGIGHLRLKTWKDVRSISTKPDLELGIYLRSSNSAQDIVLRRIFPSLPVFNITTLTLDIYPVLDFLEGAFDQLSRLQNVKVIGGCGGEFIQALTPKPKNYNDEPSAYCIPFPALQSLWIQDWLLGQGRGCNLEDLQGCLMERRERKAELLKLKLTNGYGIREEHVVSLREIVGDVEWDGRDGYDQDDEFSL
jgi:hypothetical protein